MPRVLLLHTGGTLGMKGTPLEPGDYSVALTESVPEMAMIADLEARIVANLDSSDVGPAVWTALAEEIAAARENFDGFVIVHGTDTMAYTASALAFALINLDRPVVLTGAQRPLVALRSDARRNLADAVDLATRDIPEIGICFDGLFLRGCRTTKSNAHDYRAFDSPGTEPLARLGVDIAISPHVRRPSGPFRSEPNFDANVATLRVTPGLNPNVLEHILSSGDLHGLVLAAYGVGTVPTAHQPLAPVIAEAVDAGIEVLVVTQSSGHVDFNLYKNSAPLAQAGAIPGGKMRIEAAVAKLMHAIALHEDRDARRRYLTTDVAGELG